MTRGPSFGELVVLRENTALYEFHPFEDPMKNELRGPHHTEAFAGSGPRDLGTVTDWFALHQMVRIVILTGRHVGRETWIHAGMIESSSGGSTGWRPTLIEAIISLFRILPRAWRATKWR